ncbi:MAG: hypothetical protein DMD28_12135 [Gemmatimonadetes bacterium]|nr:MAG: hypothetical protein DMD28_12135 [Gemmatimonadota bacterium]
MAKLPSAAGWVKKRVAITSTNATMRGWTLQNTRTKPGLAKMWPFASPRPYLPKSNWLGSLTEKTLWSNGS